MRFWWVNHKQTFEHEVEKGYNIVRFRIHPTMCNSVRPIEKK